MLSWQQQSWFLSVQGQQISILLILTILLLSLSLQSPSVTFYLEWLLCLVLDELSVKKKKKCQFEWILVGYEFRFILFFLRNGCIIRHFVLSEWSLWVLTKTILLWKFMKWHYRITNKKLYQIIETSLEDCQQQQQLKWIAHVTQWENKMLIFHTTSNKRLRRKPPSISMRVITTTGLEKPIILKNCFISTDRSITI